jgi:hypothetical protein
MSLFRKIKAKMEPSVVKSMNEKLSTNEVVMPVDDEKEESFDLVVDFDEPSDKEPRQDNEVSDYVESKIADSEDLSQNAYVPTKEQLDLGKFITRSNPEKKIVDDTWVLDTHPSNYSGSMCIQWSS